ncbi:uncharacterized protein KZ484_018301 [Pholidichthys leucotaenia]
MLQQILKDMYIDPDVLEALNEDQKKTLFLKMRQEQVRRWKEREEKLEREGGDAESRLAKPRKANGKSVSWLLDRDGDVAVIVIGEVDELGARFIRSGFGEKKPASPQNNPCNETMLKSRNNTEPVKVERENVSSKAQTGVSLNLKDKYEEESTLLPLPVSVSEHPAPTAVEQPELKPASAAEEKSAPQPSICSRPPTRASPVNMRPASSNVAPGSVNTRPGLANPRLAAPVPSLTLGTTVKIDSGSASPIKETTHSQQCQTARRSQNGKDVGASETCQRAASANTGESGSVPVCVGRGRVAQLMKTFSVDSPGTQTPPRGVKPPLPTKPSHLRLTNTPTVR